MGWVDFRNILQPGLDNIFGGGGGGGGGISSFGGTFQPGEWLKIQEAQRQHMNQFYQNVYGGNGNQQYIHQPFSMFTPVVRAYLTGLAIMMKRADIRSLRIDAKELFDLCQGMLGSELVRHNHPVPGLEEFNWAMSDLSHLVWVSAVDLAEGETIRLIGSNDPMGRNIVTMQIVHPDDAAARVDNDAAYAELRKAIDGKLQEPEAA